MKKLLFATLTIAGMLASCTSDELVNEPTLNDNEVNATFTISTPEGIMTRAIGDGTSVDKVACAVFDASGEEILDLRQNDVAISNKTATYTTRLVKGQAYRVAFFAYNQEAEAYELDNFKNIKVKGNQLSNAEGRDAFTAWVDITAEETNERAIAKTVRLYRPFAQLNIGSIQEDIEAAEKAGIVVKQTKVTVKNVYTAFNAFADKVVENTSEAVTFDVADVPGQLLKVGDETYTYHAMNYMLVGDKGADKSLTEVSFTWITENGNTNNPVTTWSNIPLQRNHRTNIIGHILTNPAEFNIVIDEAFEDDIDVPTALLDLINIATTGGTYNMEESITMLDTKPSLEITADLVLNMENDVELTAGDKSNYGVIIAGGTTVINGEGDINSQGGGIGVKNGASVVFNGGTLKVNSTSTSGRYLFHLEGEGSTATINGGNFDFNKSQNQKRAYIYAGEGTKVYVKGGTFGKASTRNDYKKGIYGSGSVIITGGTFGFDPTAWVAEGYKVEEENGLWTVVDNSVKFVDLGLSVLWANRNVKANSETEVGQYYSWADIVDPVPYNENGIAKTAWNWDNYEYWTDLNGNNSPSEEEMTKYNSIDKYTEIRDEDDIATLEYGADCHIPTKAQFEELVNSCTWEWDNVKKGYTVSGNGNSIFIPAGGYVNGVTYYGSVGTVCAHWTSDIVVNKLTQAHNIEFDSVNKNFGTTDRNFGMPIRAVKAK